jgi:hypothetical protein
VENLLDFVTQAHGGKEPWSRATEVTATVDIHGGFFDARGQGDLLGLCEVTAAVDRQYISLRSTVSGYTLVFDGKRDRVVVSGKHGGVVETLDHARESMLALTPLDSTTPWTAAQTGHFIGYALWTYLLEPYIFQWPGVTAVELDAWNEVGESWRRLQVTFPDSLFTHQRTQIHYFDSRTGLQRRIDYRPDVTGGRAVAHYTFEHRYFGDIPVPSARRVLFRDAEGRADHHFSPIQVDVHTYAINES